MICMLVAYNAQETLPVFLVVVLGHRLWLDIACAAMNYNARADLH